MKRFLSSFVMFLFCVTMSFAQAPKGINYQGVARDNEGNPLASKTIAVRISILKTSATGEVEYAETHKSLTNQFGLFTLIIGQGTKTTGDFAFISWAVGNKWLQIEIDPNGGSSYTLAGSQQLMTVPYAFYAEYTSNSSLTAGQGITINSGVVSNTGDADKDPTNELQNLSDVLIKSNNAGGVKITNLGAPVDVSDAATKNYVDTQNALDLDIDPTNELQDLSQLLTKGNDAGAQKITNLGTPTTATDAATKSYVDNQNALDLDQSTTNEIQDLTLNTTTNILKITNNTAPTNIDLSPYKQTLTYTPATNNLAISGGNNVTINSTLTQVLTTNPNAGNLRIQGVGTPTANTDATTKGYVDNAIATNFAFKIRFDYTNTTGGYVLNQTVPLSVTPDFDSFGVLSGNTFTAKENGVYVFTVEGSYQYSTSSAPSLFLVISGVQNPVIIISPVGGGDPKYNSTFMYKLNIGQTATLLMDLIPNNARFIGNFFGYKL